MPDVPAFAESALIKTHLVIAHFFEMSDGPSTGSGRTFLSAEPKLA